MKRKPHIHPRVKKVLQKRPYRRKAKPEQSLEQAIQGIPRITNETVAEHREEVLSSARKYIYPLQHSAHKVVIISGGLFAAVVIAFFSYSLLALYRFHSSSTFMYGVTQVIPFPAARAGSHFVSYESYLFELRHYIHYYQTQQKIDFNSDSGKQQLAEFRKRSMQSAINDAYVKQLAKQNHITVTTQELNNQIALVRSQNRLGSSDQVFADVLKEFWGWSVDDFKRELKQQMLAQKVTATLDTATQERAKNVLTQLQQGGDFATIAKQTSDDPSTRDAGGEYGFLIDRTNRNIQPQVIDAIFKMKPGQISDIITTSVGLEIVKVTSTEGDKVHASHILFLFKDSNTYIDPIKAKQKPKQYIST
ncbi:MAG TPA: peptidylprolyl isomerase [Nevskiaceae bacterium]|nr:peptidylprolyl isomerase [Nevskiaceae bacterium]